MIVNIPGEGRYDINPKTLEIADVPNCDYCGDPIKFEVERARIADEGGGRITDLHAKCWEEVGRPCTTTAYIAACEAIDCRPPAPVPTGRLAHVMLDGNEATPEEVESMCFELREFRREREEHGTAQEANSRHAVCIQKIRELEPEISRLSNLTTDLANKLAEWQERTGCSHPSAAQELLTELAAEKTRLSQHRFWLIDLVWDVHATDPNNVTIQKKIDDILGIRKP